MNFDKFHKEREAYQLLDMTVADAIKHLEQKIEEEKEEKEEKDQKNG